MARKYSQLSASEADAYLQRAHPDKVKQVLNGEDVDVEDENETPPASAAPQEEENTITAIKKRKTALRDVMRATQ